MQAALEITGCSFQGSVTGTTLVGGIIGQKYEGAAPLLMSGCFTKNSQIAGTNNNIGGLIGTVGRNSKIENSYVEGGSVTSSGGSVGGLIGNLGHSGSQSNEGYLTVIGCYATNTVTGTNSIGGLIGEIRLAGPSSTNAANLSVTQSYTGGIIQGNGAVGGLVGQIVNTNNALISECYTTASVTSAGGDIGGLVGNIPVNENTTPAITQSFALNSVITGSNNTGVLVGGNPSNTTITNGYAYDIFNAITPNAAVVTGFITKKAITTQATYVTEGWDFTNTWKWGNEYYRLPVLKNIAIQPIVQPAHLPLNGNASLNNLAVSIGILTPTFDPATIDYAVGLVYADENITITAAAAGENAIITGDGVKSLNVGDNEFTIHVEAEDQVTTTDYTLTVYREASPDDATLKELTVDEGDLDPVFAPSTTAYTVNVTNEITSINIAAISYSSKATLTGAGLKENLIVGDNDFSIVVTSEDGQVTKTYTVKVVRAPNTDATLGSLTVSEGTLDPVFDPAIVSYTVNIGNDITSIDLTATANNADATVSGDGTKNNLIVGDNGFNIVVTAQDATVTKTYTVKVVRAPIVAIKDVQNENIRFYVQDRTIVVESAQGIVTLTNLMGVSQKYASKGLLNIPVSNSGIYILTINGASYKVLVK
jgi:predicted Fe-Mo cluster-binding NifX family protein